MRGAPFNGRRRGCDLNQLDAGRTSGLPGGAPTCASGGRALLLGRAAPLGSKWSTLDRSGPDYGSWRAQFSISAKIFGSENIYLALI